MGKDRIIKIGSKSLMKELTAEDLIEIIVIEGCIPSTEFWNVPCILDFNNTLFSGTIYVDYVSYRKSDNLKSCDYTFFFNCKDFSYHYTRNDDTQNNTRKGKRVGLETLRYLIEKGFDVPL